MTATATPSGTGSSGNSRAFCAGTSARTTCSGASEATSSRPSWPRRTRRGRPRRRRSFPPRSTGPTARRRRTGTSPPASASPSPPGRGTASTASTGPRTPLSTSPRSGARTATQSRTARAGGTDPKAEEYAKGPPGRRRAAPFIGGDYRSEKFFGDRVAGDLGLLPEVPAEEGFPARPAALFAAVLAVPPAGRRSGSGRG